MVDSAGLIQMVNCEFEHLFGYSRAEIVGQPVDRTIPERFRHRYLRHHTVFRNAPAARRIGLRRDFFALLKDGSEIQVEIGLNRIETAHGPMVLCSVVDLSARKALEADLLQKEAQLKAEIQQRTLAEAESARSRANFRYLFEHNPLPMFVADESTLDFLEANTAAIEKYGYTREEFLTLKMTDIRPPEEAEKLKRFLAQQFNTDLQKSSNWIHRNKAGDLFEVDVFFRSMRYEGRSVRFVVFVDVTERNAAEMKLRQSQKMEAIGQLTGGIAHDFNNLLTVVLTNLELIGELTWKDPTIHGMVDEAIASVNRGASLTQLLLAFSRQQPLDPRVIDIRGTIQSITRLLRRSLGETIHIQHVLPERLGKACIDPHQLESALLNLAVNARDAMPNGGNLTIEAESITVDATFNDQNPEIAPGDYILLTVSDTGTGMTREVMERILEPFYTTKPLGQGTGLGLSMVYGFVHQSGGHLKIYSEPGVGTTVKLYLARTPDPPAVSTQPEPTAAESTLANGEVILLVEDDPVIRKLVIRLLTMLGYEVLDAEDGPTALRTIAQAPRIELLFTDIVLPNGMTGVELAQQARRHHPNLKVLFMSGYTKNALTHSGVPYEGIHLLSKPFQRDELCAAIQRVLHESSPNP